MLVDTDNVLEKRYFKSEGTGGEIKNAENLTYIATFQEPPFVWHLFEVKK